MNIEGSLLVIFGIIGTVAGIYIILSPGRIPSGELIIQKNFKGLLLTGAIFISLGEIALVIDALNIPSPIPLHIIHDILMAVSLIFIALAIRELTKLKPTPISQQ